MNLFGVVMLIVWLPLVVFFLNTMPPKRAVPTMFVTAWLLMPGGSLPLPGLPDYNKMSSTMLGVLMWAIAFDQARLFSVRLRWLDLPMLILCFEPFLTAMTNGLGPYEGMSAVIDSLFNWGFPYLIGRIYLSDLEAMKELVRAIVIGALCYLPLCLFEIRFSPTLNTWIYGIVRWDGERYGGYRPKVFLTHGLELGMWMTNSCLLMYTIWYSGAIKSIRGIPIGKVALALFIVTIFCKSTGALILLFFAVGVLWATRKFKITLFIWMTLAIPPVYCYVRATDTWSGQQAVDIATSTVGAERAQSIEYRFEMEKKLSLRSLERPIFGWGRFGRFMTFSKEGVALTVPDGYWIIMLGGTGIVGLSAMISLFSLPMILTMRRFPIKDWENPDVAPMVGLAMVLALTMIDFLSNAMPNTLYPLAIGGFMGLKDYQLKKGHDEAEEALAFASECVQQGRIDEADHEFRRAIELASETDDFEARRIQAASFDGLGHALMAIGNFRDSASAFGEALILRDELTAEFPDDDHFRDLAIARDGLSRALAEAQRTVEAIEHRQVALEIWKILAAKHPRDAEYRDHLVNTLNDLAWLITTYPDASPDDLTHALALAEHAVGVSTNHEALWNTLGVARYRAGDWAGAIESLERSALESPGGQGTAFDHYFLAMAWCRLQHVDQAEEWLERGKAWAARHRPGHPSLERFREEAEALLAAESAE